MRFIFKDIAQKLLTKDRVLKYQTWIEEAEKARKVGSLNEKKNQYDKAEELITFYTFAPLERVPDEVKNKVVQEILNLIGINESVGEVKLYFERDLPAPDSYLKWLSEEVKHHSIRYIRKGAETRKRLEGSTQVDAIIETDNLLILIEVKFTSDISPYTKFGLVRNQIARVVDVGISEAQRQQKKLVALLCTPSELFIKRSRLYYYKMQEYSDLSNVKSDIPWHTIDEIRRTLLKTGWISLEEIIKLVYRSTGKYFNQTDIKEVEQFFKERMLF